METPSTLVLCLRTAPVLVTAWSTPHSSHVVRSGNPRSSATTGLLPWVGAALCPSRQGGSRGWSGVVDGLPHVVEPVAALAGVAGGVVVPGVTDEVSGDRGAEAARVAGGAMRA